MWAGFFVFIISMLILDLFVFYRRTHEVKIKEALLLSLFWVSLAFLFNIGIYLWYNKAKALEFLTAYLVEKSLSVDNLFVFLVLFSYFNIQSQYQHKVLFWGIIGAFLMRALFIFAGIALISKFHWIIYIFGGFLIITGIKLSFEKKEKVNPQKNIFIKIFKKLMPVTTKFKGEKFFIKKMDKIIATPLFICLIAIETTDIVFAIDSVPAVLAISRDPFIAYTSNAFAILGLRALYFALSGIMQMFSYLKYGLSVILVFIGIKMIMEIIYPLPTLVALGFIAITLLVCILASFLWPQKVNKSEQIKNTHYTKRRLNSK